MTEPNHSPEVKAVIDELALAMPGVKGGKAFGYPAYKINGKVFTFVGGSGIAIKLPKARVQALIDQRRGQPFEVVDGVIWQEWLSITHADAQNYHADLELLEESMAFVAGG
jgi:hypothetical protein